jgi:hypothetical protein
VSTTERLEYAKLVMTLDALMTTSGSGGPQSLPSSIGGTVTLANGTGDLQGTKIMQIYNTNLSNTNIDINVTSGLDKAGIAAALAKISAVAVKYESGTAGTYLTVKQPASNGVTNIFDSAGHGLKLAVGEWHIFPFVSARPVVASTGDIICNLVSTVTDAYYSVVIIGS